MNLISFSSLEIHALYYYYALVTFPWELCENCTDKPLEKPQQYTEHVENKKGLTKEVWYVQESNLTVWTVADAYVTAIFNFEIFQMQKWI